MVERAGINVDPYFLTDSMPNEFYAAFPVSVRADIRSRFEYQVRWNHDMWRRTGGGFDKIEGSITVSAPRFTLAKISQTNQRLGSGVPLTMDATGITMDSTFWTADRTQQ